MASASESAEIRVLSWNISGLKANLEEEERKTKLLEIFDDYDIVLLQETKIGEMKDDKDDDKYWKIITEALSDKYALVKLEGQTLIREDEEEEDKPKTMYMTYFSSRSKGVAILVNKPHTLLKYFYEGGYYAWVHVEIGGLEYTFVSVYIHPDADGQIRNLMTEIFDSFSIKGLYVSTCRLVIGGDFNTTLNPELDATRDMPAHAARRERQKAFLSKEDMSDVWREMLSKTENPTERKYTYKHHNGAESRLDYIFILKDDLKYVERCEIRNDIDLSDHSPVSLTRHSIA